MTIQDVLNHVTRRNGGSSRPVLSRGRAALVLVGCIIVACTACFSGGSSEDPPAPTPGTRTIAREPAGPAVTPSLQPTPALLTGPVTLTYSLPFVWPADGPLTSVMGPEHPSGIDIGLDAGGSLDVRAASSGVVTRAGGSDGDALGIAVVIDHGGGITTVYGHLAELSVGAGDSVSTGQVIGLGGATGDATGVHLHFEVRKDGQTIDPLDVLQTGVPDTATRTFDCDQGRVALPAGSLAWLDFSRLLGANEQVVSARARVEAGGETTAGAVEDGSIVALRVPVDFRATRTEQMRLELTIDNARGNRTVTCGLLVEHEAVPTTFYARAAGAGHEETALPPAPTPTPTPRSSLEPQYATPVVGNPSAAPPEVRPPVAATPVVSQPSYGGPGVP